jgi:transposase
MARKIWAGLDVGVETTSICVIDDSGQVLRQATCRTLLKDVHRELGWLKRRRCATIGLEAGVGVSLARGLRTLGYSVDLYEARMLSKFLRVRRNKTDAGDAIGIAEAGRVGATLVSKVHVKSLESQSLQSRLTIRRHLIKQRVRTCNLLCRQLELYGGRVPTLKPASKLYNQVEKEIKKLFGGAANPLAAELRHLAEQLKLLSSHQQSIDRDWMRFARKNEVCRRFMEIPGVGPVCALSFYAAVGEPHRFGRCADIGAYFGLTPKLHQSGLTVRPGRISKMGNKAVRALLVHAATSFMQWADDCQLRRWTALLEQRRGRCPSRVALARKLAVIMLAMWKSGECYEMEAVQAANLQALGEPT